MANRIEERIDGRKSVAEGVVILSGAGISLREILVEPMNTC
jgi:hypothetical protein